MTSIGSYRSCTLAEQLRGQPPGDRAVRTPAAAGRSARRTPARSRPRPAWSYASALQVAQRRPTAAGRATRRRRRRTLPTESRSGCATAGGACAIRAASRTILAGSSTAPPRASDAADAPGASAARPPSERTMARTAARSLVGRPRRRLRTPPRWPSRQSSRTIFPTSSPDAIAASPSPRRLERDRAVDQRPQAGRVQERDHVGEFGLRAHRRAEHLQLQEEHPVQVGRRVRARTSRRRRRPCRRA